VFWQKAANLDEMDISPHCIVNLDETGVGASKSGRQKSRTVVMRQSLSKTPIFKDSTDSRFVTALGGIMAMSRCQDSSRSLSSVHFSGMFGAL
jgi:hypothetical protein